jgi:hypothetical protein
MPFYIGQSSDACFSTVCICLFIESVCVCNRGLWVDGIQLTAFDDAAGDGTYGPKASSALEGANRERTCPRGSHR